MIRSTPATALIKTKRKTEIRCSQSCNALCFWENSACTGGSRSAVRVSVLAGGPSAGEPGSLEMEFGFVVTRNSTTAHDHPCRITNKENQGQDASGYSTTSGP